MSTDTIILICSQYIQREFCPPQEQVWGSGVTGDLETKSAWEWSAWGGARHQGTALSSAPQPCNKENFSSEITTDLTQTCCKHPSGARLCSRQQRPKESSASREKAENSPAPGRLGALCWEWQGWAGAAPRHRAQGRAAQDGGARLSSLGRQGGWAGSPVCPRPWHGALPQQGSSQSTHLSSSQQDSTDVELLQRAQINALLKHRGPIVLLLLPDLSPE